MECFQARSPPGRLDMRASQAELVAHCHNLAVAEVDFEEFRAGHRVAVLVFQGGNDLARVRIDHVGCVTPGITAIEAERDPAMTAGAQLHLSLLFGWHFCGVKDEELPAVLVADPELFFVRGERGAVGAVRDRRVCGEHAIGHLPGAQIGHVESDMTSQTKVGVSISAIDGEWEDAAFADSVEVADQPVVLGAEDPEIGLGAEIGEFAVETGDAVMGLQAGGQPLHHVAVLRAHHHEPAIRAAIPPPGGRENPFSIGADAGPIDARVVGAFPKNLFRLEIEGAKAPAGARIVDSVVPGIAAKSAQPFLERDVDAPDQAMTLVDVENKNPPARATRLRAVGGAHVEVTFKAGIARVERGQGKDPEAEQKNKAHGPVYGWGITARQAGSRLERDRSPVAALCSKPSSGLFHRASSDHACRSGTVRSVLDGTPPWPFAAHLARSTQGGPAVDPSSFRIATVFSVAFGTKELASTNSGIFEPSGLRSEQWPFSPQGPRPSRVGTASQMKLPSLNPPRSSTFTGMPRSRPACCQTDARRSVPGFRGQGRLSLRISRLTWQAKRSTGLRTWPGPASASKAALACAYTSGRNARNSPSATASWGTRLSPVPPAMVATLKVRSRDSSVSAEICPTVCANCTMALAPWL